MADEIELKFNVGDYNGLVRNIKSMAEYKGSAKELTVMYDNPERTLHKNDARLRIRKIVDIKSDQERCELSYKKPKLKEGVKIEDENEVEVSSFNELESILKKLGYSAVSSYERIRDTFMADGCKITVDSFSFGDFLEIEGDMVKIKTLAIALGFSLEKNITKPYDDIYADACKLKGEKISDNILLGDTLSEKINLRKVLDNR